MFKSVNPYNGELLAEFQSDKNIELKLQKAESAYKVWSKTPLSFRKELVEKFANNLEEKAGAFGKIISLEMGKILQEAAIELNKCVVTTRYYADNAENYLQPQILNTRYHKSYYAFEPMGTILSIMPWNFPFWQALRFAIPNLLLGNTVLLKHAPNVLWSAKNIEETFREAGFDEGIFQCLNIEVSDVEKVISDKRIKGVTLTGSNVAGASVASLAGKYLKKSVLELGGSDPFIVLKDANLEDAVQTATLSRFQNAGQTCIAAKRWIIESSIYDEFKDRVLSQVQTLKVGNPLEEGITTGPVARPDLALKIENQVKSLTAAGANPITKWNRTNCLIQPQILEISRGLSLSFTEELFGPVACLIKAKDADEAIEIANETSFGLGASLWTKDIEKGENLMQQINAGAVYLNGMTKSEGAIPFGGTNNSGYGRELAVYGMHEFANIKSYAISK
jgi:succinate-semialdehyde dehydrogenase/glutarate-semialdehyde dehydrogenase